MKRDKLDRWRTTETAVLTLRAGVPFWWGLTPRERTYLPGRTLRAHFQRLAADRRAFRNFVRALCAGETSC